MEIADRLINAIRESGDLRVAAPSLASPDIMDVDEDEVMLSSTHQSQFTRSLMLFSQTQSDTRYTPHLTQFYASLAPALLTPLIQEFLEKSNVQCKPLPPAANERGVEVGGKDARREYFKGWVEVEMFTWNGVQGSFCFMKKDEGNPISWRQLWRFLVQSDLKDLRVLRK